MAKNPAKNVSKRSHHLAQLITYEHLVKIRKKVRAGEELLKHEAQFALDVQKVVAHAIDKGKGSEDKADWNPDALEEKLRAAVVSAKKEAAS